MTVVAICWRTKEHEAHVDVSLLMCMMDLYSFCVAYEMQRYFLSVDFQSCSRTPGAAMCVALPCLENASTYLASYLHLCKARFRQSCTCEIPSTRVKQNTREIERCRTRRTHKHLKNPIRILLKFGALCHIIVCLHVEAYDPLVSWLKAAAS